MKKNPNTLWAIGATLLVAVLIVISLRGVPAAASSLPRERYPSIEVEPALQNRLAAGEGDFGYLIYFRERPDLSPALEMDWESRGRFVASALQAAAQESQGNVRAYLDRQGVRYQSYWADNVIVVQRGSSAATFNRLLDFPEIQALRARRHPAIHDALPNTEVEAEIQVIETNLTHIGTDQVWAMGITGEGITVANIDTGVRYTHEALVNQYRGNLGGTFDHNYNWWDPSPGGSDLFPNDQRNHGSHTMGIMVGDNGTGYHIGMAPGADWIACQGFEVDDQELLECGQFMLAPWDLNGENPNPDLRPHIVNNSWGDSTPCPYALDPWFKGVVASWQAAGIYPVFSNGNASNCGLSVGALNTVGNPARYGEVTGVGATSHNSGVYQSYSLWGPTDDADTINPLGYPYLKPQVVAPGSSIVSAYSIYGDQFYAAMTGTSMAAPHVAGLVALMWEAAPCLIGDYAATETLLMQTANPVPVATNYGNEPLGNVVNYATGWGEIDALAAVQAAMALCPLNASPDSQSVCVPSETTYQVTTSQGFPGPVDLDISGVPEGAGAQFNPDSLTPPATSILTVTLSAHPAAGDYPLQIHGVSGVFSYTDTVYLGVRTDVPGMPTLSVPVDDAHGVYETPTLVWGAVPQADQYALEIALDPGFSTLVFSRTVGTTSQKVEDRLAYNTQYYWRVTPVNNCGAGPNSQSFQFVTRRAPPLLVVDDDDNAPDRLGVYTQTLETIGMPYAVWDNQPLGIEPDAAFLAQFRAVVWFTGGNAYVRTGPGDAGAAALGTWLDRGGCLLLTSQDYQWANRLVNQGVTDFMINYLGVTSVTDYIRHPSVTGAGSVFGNLGNIGLEFPLWDGYENFSDGMIAAAGAEVAFTGLSTAAVNWDSGTFKTTYWGFPFDVMDDPADRVAAMQAFIDWCQPFRVTLPVVFH